jgi:hypothetical protein
MLSKKSALVGDLGGSLASINLRVAHSNSVQQLTSFFQASLGERQKNRSAAHLGPEALEILWARLGPGSVPNILSYFKSCLKNFEPVWETCQLFFGSFYDLFGRFLLGFQYFIFPECTRILGPKSFKLYGAKIF